jgi:ribosome-binding factor A
MKPGGVGGFRTERIAEEIRHELSLMLAGELKDPRLASSVTVTEIRLGPGMRTVRVFVQIEGSEEDRATVLKGLKAASSYMRHELIERLHLRRAPEIIFHLDQSTEYGQHIEELLRKVKSPQ